MFEQIELSLLSEEIFFIYETKKASDEIYVTNVSNNKDTLLDRGVLTNKVKDSKVEVFVGKTKIAIMYPMQTTILFKLFAGNSAQLLMNELGKLRNLHDNLRIRQ